MARSDSGCHHLSYSMFRAEYAELEVLEGRADITYVWVPPVYLLPGHSALFSQAFP